MYTRTIIKRFNERHNIVSLKERSQRLFSTAMGVDNIRFGSDTDVIQLVTHNAPLTLCVLLTSKARD